MTDDAAVPQLIRARIRKYFLVVFGLIGGAIVLLMLTGIAVKTIGAESKTAGMVLGIVAPLLMLGVVASSWYAVYKLWRCPKCERSIYWTVSWNMSVFAGSASPNCPGCGVALFPPDYQKRTRRVFVILIAVAMGMGFLAAIAAATMAPKRQHATVTDTPRPPG